MSGAKLHEVIAVEADLAGAAKRILEEAEATFRSKSHLFTGKVRTLELFAGDDEVSKTAAEDAEKSIDVLTTTVPDKLKYVWESVVRYWDAVGQKERTNQAATADLVVGGVTVLSGVPVTFLLSLENKLKALRQVYDAIPTLLPNIPWVDAPDLGPNIKRSPEVSTLKTAKTIDFRITAPATDRHQAQVVQVEKVSNVGVFKQTTTSGMVTPYQKSIWLGRIDDLIRSVKQARQRANEVELVSITSTSAITSYIHGDELNALAGEGSVA